MAFLLILGTAFATTSTVLADTFTVTSIADPGDGTCDDAGTGDGCTLREAIAAADANPGDDIITFAGGVTGTITLTGGQLSINSNIEIQGPGDDLLSVDGNDLSRVFLVGAAVTVGVSGLTITNGSTAGDGGGILNQGTLTLDDCTISSNEGNFGGGISNTNSGVLTVENSVIADNTASSDGGGIDNFTNGTLTVYNTIITGNSADTGGGVVHESGADTTTIEMSTIIDNDATSGSGGGLAVFGGGVTVLRSTIDGNSSTAGGGGISITSGTLTLLASTINGNADTSTNASSGAGGLSMTGAPTATVENSTFSGNTALGAGGGITVGGGTLNLLSSTITDNTAPSGEGSGVKAIGTAEVQNTIIAGNTATDVDGAGFTSNGHNLVGDGDATGSFNQTGDQTGAEPKLGPLDDYGGPTETHTLLEGSPAIDTGDTDLTIDQRGEPRPDGSADDIGSFEGFLPVTESLIVTTTDDEDDHTSDPAFGNGTSLREAINFANSDSDNSVITFAGGVTGSIILTSGLSLSTDIDIQGPGDALLSVDADGTGRVFIVTGSVTSAGISGLTITGGNTAGDGGGILNQGNSLTVTGCTISDNEATFGGGIANTNGGVLTVENSVIADNTANSDGGGIDNFTDGVLTVRNSTISGNSADAGGGVVHESGADTTTIEMSTIIDNDATSGSGGGLAVFGGGVAVMTSTIDGNSSTSGGGGISIIGGTLTLLASTINGNADISTNASSGAGGLSMTGAPTATVENSTFSGNTAFGAGGGITVGGGILNLLSSTITGNTAPSGEGSGVKAIGTAQVQNTIIAGNTTTDVDGAGFTSNGHNLIGDGDATGDFNQTGDQTGVSNPKLGPLQDNGGPTETHSLEIDSPALDAGQTDLATDQRGFGRPQGLADDIGAFEFEAVLLAVELSAFTVLLDGSTAALAWQTESETINAGFSIEHRAPDADGFAEIGFVGSTAPGGTTIEPQNYSYSIEALDVGLHHFRLKQIDLDGAFAYSPEVTATVELAERYQLSAVYPNPFNPRASFTLAVQVAQQVEVTLYDVMGRSVAVLHRGLMEGGRSHRFEIDGSPLGSGTYVLRVLGENFRQDRPVTVVK